MQISPLGGWLVSALPIPIGGEWHNSSTDFNPDTNSSILLQCKNKLQVHIKPTPTKQDPKQNIVCTTYCMCSTEYHHQYCMWNKNQYSGTSHQYFKKMFYRDDRVVVIFSVEIGACLLRQLSLGSNQHISQIYKMGEWPTHSSPPQKNKKKFKYSAMFRIRMHRIRKFLGHLELDPELLVPVRIRILPSSSKTLRKT